MLYRATLMFFVVLGLSVPAIRSEEKKPDANTHEGKIVKIDGNKLTMTDKEGKNEHTHTISPDAKITCDAKECKLADLKVGVAVTITTKKGDKDMAVKVEARTKNPTEKDK